LATINAIGNRVQFTGGSIITTSSLIANGREKWEAEQESVDSWSFVAESTDTWTEIPEKSDSWSTIAA
jgi:hypothetical protein